MGTTGSIDARIAERHLLKHPFYQAWTAGTLPREALLDYVGQYYAFESILPGLLKSLAARAESPAAREALLANAWDEEHGPNNHPELWLRFGEALGLDRAHVVGARLKATTQTLVDTYREAAESAPVACGVAALYAYESQLPAVAEAKIAGLKAHFGFGERAGDGQGEASAESVESRRGLAFFEVHRTIDVHHAAEERRILESGENASEGASAEATVAWAERALEAWWNFLSGVYPAGENCVVGYPAGEAGAVDDGSTLTSRMASLN
jgi:pyrroloquinoline-quinone synthase